MNLSVDSSDHKVVTVMNDSTTISRTMKIKSPKFDRSSYYSNKRYTVNTDDIPLKSNRKMSNLPSSYHLSKRRNRLSSTKNNKNYISQDNNKSALKGESINHISSEKNDFTKELSPSTYNYDKCSAKVDNLYSCSKHVDLSPVSPYSNSKENSEKNWQGISRYMDSNTESQYLKSRYTDVSTLRKYSSRKSSEKHRSFRNNSPLVYDNKRKLPERCGFDEHRRNPTYNRKYCSNSENTSTKFSRSKSFKKRSLEKFNYFYTRSEEKKPIPQSSRRLHKPHSPRPKGSYKRHSPEIEYIRDTKYYKPNKTYLKDTVKSFNNDEQRQIRQDFFMYKKERSKYQHSSYFEKNKSMSPINLEKIHNSSKNFGIINLERTEHSIYRSPSPKYYKNDSRSYKYSPSSLTNYRVRLSNPSYYRKSPEFSSKRNVILKNQKDSCFKPKRFTAKFQDTERFNVTTLRLSGNENNTDDELMYNPHVFKGSQASPNNCEKIQYSRSQNVEDASQTKTHLYHMNQPSLKDFGLRQQSHCNLKNRPQKFAKNLLYHKNETDEFCAKYGEHSNCIDDVRVPISSQSTLQKNSNELIPNRKSEPYSVHTAYFYRNETPKNNYNCNARSQTIERQPSIGMKRSANEFNTETKHKKRKIDEECSGTRLPLVNDEDVQTQSIDSSDQYPFGLYHLKISKLASERDYNAVKNFFLRFGKILAFKYMKGDCWYTAYVRFENDSVADKIVNKEIKKFLVIKGVEFYPESTKTYRAYKEKHVNKTGLSVAETYSQTSNKIKSEGLITSQCRKTNIDAAGDRTSFGGISFPQLAPMIQTGPYIGQFHLSIRNIFAGKPKLQVDVTDFLNNYGTPSHIDFRNLRRNDGLRRDVVDAYVKYSDDASASNLLDEVQAINIYNTWCNVRPTMEFTAYRNRDNTNKLKLADPGIPVNAPVFKGKWHLRTGKFLMNDESLKTALRQFYQQFGTISSFSVQQSKHKGYLLEKSKYDAFVLFNDSNVPKKILDLKIDFTYQWKQKHIIPSKEFKFYLNNIRSMFSNQFPTTDADQNTWNEQSVAKLTKLCYLDPTGVDTCGYRGEYHISIEPFNKIYHEQAGDSVLTFVRQYGRVAKVQLQPFFSHHSFVGSIKIQKNPTFAQLRVNVRFTSDQSADSLLKSNMKFCYKGRNMLISATDDYSSYFKKNG